MTIENYTKLLDIYIKHQSTHPDSDFDFVYANYDLSSKLLRPKAKVFWFKEDKGACLIYALSPNICYIDFIYIYHMFRKSKEVASFISEIRDYIKSHYKKVICDVFTKEGENLMKREFNAIHTQIRYVREFK